MGPSGVPRDRGLESRVSLQESSMARARQGIRAQTVIRKHLAMRWYLCLEDARASVQTATFLYPDQQCDVLQQGELAVIGQARGAFRLAQATLAARWSRVVGPPAGTSIGEGIGADERLGPRFQ